MIVGTEYKVNKHKHKKQHTDTIKKKKKLIRLIGLPIRQLRSSYCNEGVKSSSEVLLDNHATEALQIVTDCTEGGQRGNRRGRRKREKRQINQIKVIDSQKCENNYRKVK